MAMQANLETLLAIAGLPKPVREFRFDGRRKWRFDFAWPDERIALEQEGGTWVGGRHNRPEGYAGDCEKYNAALLQGWKVYRFTADMIADGRALVFLEKLGEEFSR